MLERRAAGEPHVHAHLHGDDLREGRLAEPWRAVEQHVIERIAALARGLDEDAHLVLDRHLTDEVVERARSERGVGDALRFEFVGADHALVGHRGVPDMSSRRSAAPTRSATLSPSASTATAATALRASLSRKPRPTK